MAPPRLAQLIQADADRLRRVFPDLAARITEAEMLAKAERPEQWTLCVHQLALYLFEAALARLAEEGRP